jgi:hypothetical protein
MSWFAPDPVAVVPLQALPPLKLHETGESPQQAAGESHTVRQSACMAYDDNLAAEPGKVITLAVYVIPTPCGSAKELYAENRLIFTSAQPSRIDVTIPMKVKADLSAPFFDGKVVAVFDDVATFGMSDVNGRWQWQVKPDNPGDFALPLSLGLYDDNGEHPANVSPFVSVHLHVPMTAGYATASTWSGILAFLVSIQSLIASVAGAAAGSAGFWALMTRKSNKQAEPAATAPAPSSSGYL